MIITENSSLFLDRDGVLNEELPNDYVKHISELKIYNYIYEALPILKNIFNKIFIVTNQKGIGKKLMTDDDLTNIHNHLVNNIKFHGGTIDKVYYCSALDDNNTHRKPNAGMAFDALADYPTINLKQSIMVGNNMSDMLFGRNAGMQTVLVTTTNKPYTMPHNSIDYQFENLLAATHYMQQLK